MTHGLGVALLGFFRRFLAPGVVAGRQLSADVELAVWFHHRDGLLLHSGRRGARLA